MKPSTADFTGLLTGTNTLCENDLTEKAEEIADHVRCGKFEDLVKKAKNVQVQHDADKAEYLCVTGKDGSISREKDLQRLRNVQNAMREERLREEFNAGKEDILLQEARVQCDALRNNSAYSSNLEVEVGAGSGGDDELALLRKKRLAQMRREKQMSEHWRAQGHGALRLISSELEFFEKVKPHERAVVVIHSGGDPECSLQDPDSLLSKLGALAQTHLETGMFHLHEEKARFLLSMLEIPDGGLPLLFILRHGEVICRIGRAVLAEVRVNKMGKRTLEKLLKSRDAFGEGAAEHSGRGGGAESDSHSEESSDMEEKHRKRLEFQRF